MWTIAAEQLIQRHAEATAERTALLFMSSLAQCGFSPLASRALDMKLVIDAA